jgi:5-methylcytosine-specific restriction endonuclease McrA
MADTLVERVTGQTAAAATPVEINLVMSDQTLVAGDDAPAHLEGYGPIPAPVARALVRDADRTWVRRLFTRPADSELVAMDSRRRLFAGDLRRFVVVRDQFCRTPWCDAPIRHADHIVRAADGGASSADNGQGLCEACNLVKESPGWGARRRPGRRHRVETTTPTGHRHTSHAPDLPGSVDLAWTSPLERTLGRLVA